MRPPRRRANPTIERANAAIEEEFDLDRLRSNNTELRRAIRLTWFHWMDVSLPTGRTTALMLLNWERDDVARRLVAAVQYLSPGMRQFYFSLVEQYRSEGLLQESQPPDSDPETRLEVVDLASLRDRANRLVATNAILESAWRSNGRDWRQALDQPAADDTRVPTFIVVDEAHNLIPSEPLTERDSVVRDQFRTIAAEGRKYGMFLILVTQRPDKLDPWILSECENTALMRINSNAVLKVAKTAMGLEDIPEPMLRRSIEFGVGRALFAGRWVNYEPQFMFAAARRTQEGGRNLRSEHWAVPF